MVRVKGRKTNRIARHDPLTATDAPVRDGGHKRTSIPPTLRKLKSPDEKERLDAITAITSMLEDTDTRRFLLKNNILPLLLDRLTDSVSAIVLEASGALRNLTIEENDGLQCCETLNELNVLSILELQMQRSIQIYQSPMDDHTKKYEFKLSENMIAIQLAFCETSEEVLQAINNTSPTLLPFLMTLLSFDKTCPQSLTTLAGQCLVSYTDDNDSILSRINHDTAMLTLIRTLAKTEKDIFIATFMACTLQTLVRASEPARDSSTLVIESLQTLERSLGQFDFVAIAKLTADDQSQTISMIETILETLSKVATIRRDESGDDTQMGDTDQDRQSLSDSDETILRQLVDHFISSVIKFASPIDIGENESYPMKLHSTHLLALDCLHNLAWSLVDVPQSYEVAIRWQSIADEVWRWCLLNLPKFLVIDEEIADSSISLLYALAKALAGKVAITNDDVNSFIKLYNSSLNADLQSKIVGLLGCLAMTPGRVDINRSIGTFLITVTVSLPRTDPDAALEAINAIFDIYGDAAFDYDEPVFVKGNFLKHLRDANVKLKTMKKTINRKMYRGLWTRADEAIQNLEGFIEYKENERS